MYNATPLNMSRPKALDLINLTRPNIMLLRMDFND